MLPEILLHPNNLFQDDVLRGKVGSKRKATRPPPLEVVIRGFRFIFFHIIIENSLRDEFLH